jgi:hypothetical protein
VSQTKNKPVAATDIAQQVHGKNIVVIALSERDHPYTPGIAISRYKRFELREGEPVFFVIPAKDQVPFYHIQLMDMALFQFQQE